MKTLTVYYSISNNGDGSTSVHWFESGELAAWDDEHQYEGWAEPCDGHISFESESNIVCLDEISTKESYLIERYMEEWEYIKEYESDGDDSRVKEAMDFIKLFFPEGIPKFTVETEKAFNGYKYNYVFVGDKKVARLTETNADSGKILEDKLNNFKFE